MNRRNFFLALGAAGVGVPVAILAAEPRVGRLENLEIRGGPISIRSLDGGPILIRDNVIISTSIDEPAIRILSGEAAS